MMRNIVLLGTFGKNLHNVKKVFETKSTENYPQDVKAVRAREIKVKDVDRTKQEVNGEDMVVDVIRVHEAVIKHHHHHRPELRDR